MLTNTQILPALVGVLALLGAFVGRSPASWPFFGFVSAGLFVAMALLESGASSVAFSLAVLAICAGVLFLLRQHRVLAMLLTFAVLLAAHVSGRMANAMVPAVLVGFSYALFRLHDFVLAQPLSDKSLPVRSLLHEGLLRVFAFPARTAGPIILQNDFRINPRTISLGSAFYRRGLWLCALGFVKILIVLPLLRHHFETGLLLPFRGDLTAFRNLLQTAAFQYARIYLDFSGYTDIAVGLCALLGLRVRHNFRRPFAAISLADFWRRWHITLSYWVRRHLYIPLGGSRRGAARTAVNLLAAMLLIGLWHGLSFGFVLWGLLHGLALVLERFAFVPLLQSSGLAEHPGVIGMRWLVTQSTVALLWIPFFWSTPA